jgi:hypothetical protein
LFIDNIGSVSCLTVLFVRVVRFGFVVVVTVRDAPRVLYGLVGGGELAISTSASPPSV